MRPTKGRSDERVARKGPVGGSEFLQLVLDLSTQLINLRSDEIDDGIRKALGRIGNFHGADRAYLARFTRDYSRFSLTHEWVAQDVPPVQMKWIGVSTKDFEPILESFLKLEPVMLKRPEDLPPGPGRDAAVASGARSVLLAPIVHGGKVRGFIGLSSLTEDRLWSDEAVSLLTVSGAMCLNAMERKRAETALRMMRFSVESTTDLCFWIDQDAKFFYVNHAACRALGYTRAELLGMTVHDLDPNYPVEVWQDLWERVATERKLTMDSRLRRKDGEEFPVEVRANFQRFEGREIIFAFVRDVSGHKEAEEERRRLATAAEHTAEGILIADADGTVNYANPAFERIVGRRRHDLDGCTLQELFGDRWQTIRRERHWTGRITIAAEGEDDIAMDASITAIHDADDEPLGFVCISHDVSERARMEAMLRQSQKMEAIGQLAGGVAHDFNNMLQAMKGYTTLALSVLPKPEKAKAHLDEVLRASERAGDLVRQLLTFSRREALRYEYLNLDEVVGGVMKMLRRVIGEHLDLDVRPGAEGDIVHADKGQVEQIMMNLCVNARDAMPDGGRIRIRTGTATFDREHADAHRWSRAGKFAYLSVSDTGCGIQKDLQERIFEPFFTTKEFGSGTGLGLATVYAIVERHGGLLRVISEPGKGTEFRIFLPVVEAPVVVAAAKGLSEEARGGSETILLAEDDEQVRSLAGKVLRKAGYTVLVARDGEEAIRIFSEHSDTVDLALLDVVMPKKSGRVVHDTIKETHPHVEVLFCTGYSYRELDSGRLPEGGFHVLQKPYRADDLLRKIREALDSDSRLIG